MSVIINTNSAATIASNNLSASNAMLQRSLNRLSSGSKIVNASDDAGGVAVAAQLSASAKRTGVVSQNISSALSFLQTQDSGLKTVSKMLERMSELQALYTNETATTQQGNYATEFDALADEIGALENDTMNGVAVFHSAGISVFTNDTLDDDVTFGEADLAGEAIDDFAIDGASINDDINEAIDAIAAMRAENGAKQSILGFYGELNAATKSNYESAVSRIVDVDVAEESTQLARWNTLVQAGTAMIAQANGSTQSALTLLR
jgi:flagellin